MFGGCTIDSDALEERIVIIEREVIRMQYCFSVFISIISDVCARKLTQFKTNVRAENIRSCQRHNKRVKETAEAVEREYERGDTVKTDRRFQL